MESAIDRMQYSILCTLLFPLQESTRVSQKDADDCAFTSGPAENLSLHLSGFFLMGCRNISHRMMDEHPESQPHSLRTHRDKVLQLSLLG